MARTTEELVQLQLGSQALQLARLIAENEALSEKVKELEGVIASLKEPKNLDGNA